MPRRFNHSNLPTIRRQFSSWWRTERRASRMGLAPELRRCGITVQRCGQRPRRTATSASFLWAPPFAALALRRRWKCICGSDGPLWRLGKWPRWESDACVWWRVRTAIIYTIRTCEAAITAASAMLFFAGENEHWWWAYALPEIAAQCTHRRRGPPWQLNHRRL